MGYRDNWFKHNKPSFGKKYKCVSCKKLFTKETITIDHRIPKRDGGTDDLWNLQPMCRSCNSSKRDRQTMGENMNTLARSAVAGDLDKALKGIAKQKIKDAFGFKYKR